MPVAAVQPAGAAHLVQLLAQAGNTVADQPAIGFDLRFARAAQKAEAAALAFKVGPTAHQPAGLILQMRQFHLQRAFGGGSTLAKDFQDQPGSIDHLGLQRLLQIALLHR